MKALIMSLEDLSNAICDCKKCPLSKSRTNAVPGTGKPDAEILFIGEGPGETEDRQGKPFIGEAGKFLDEMLASVNLTRDEVFITNVVKCRPPHNRDPLDEEVRICTSNYLFSQIKVVKPKLIVTLGRHSMHLFFPQIKSVSQVHGKAFKKAGQVYLVLYHPAAALHQVNLRETLKEDFLQIPKIMNQITN